MNSNYGKSNAKSGSLNGFDFDLGLNSNHARSLNDQKNHTSSYSSSSSYTGYSSKTSATPSWTYQPNKPSWTHQPAASNQAGAGSLSDSSSMVGDIFGKTWSSSAPSRTGKSDTGIGKKDPNLFSDLVNSSLSQNKGNSNVPLKNAAPAGVSKSSFSMGSMTDSLPKTTSSSKTGGNWASDSFGSGYNVNNNVRPNVSLNGNANKSSNLGGPSMKSMAGSGVGVGGGIGSSKDPFGSLVDFSSKPSGGMNSGNKGNSKTKVGDDAFGDFQNASKTNNPTFPSNNFSEAKSNSMGSTATYSNLDDFGFASSSQSQSQPSVHSTFADDFGFSSGQSQNQPSVQSTGMNDFDSLFSSTGSTEKGSEAFGNQQFSGGDDWGMDSEFGGGNDSGGTTELEGLPPPPAGVSASAAKSKGLDNHKQGQYADAIKWLSWAVILLEKSGDDSGSMEVLSCRASCYKEVGEYKKAVADCTKVLQHDDKNVAVLVQRALLYESMEKYKLGAEDLRTVMKLDPGNRVARSTIHRLTKMAG